MASGLRPRRFTAINSDVVDNNYNTLARARVHALQTLAIGYMVKLAYSLSLGAW